MVKKNIFLGMLLSALLVSIGGCGYTTKSLLPSNIQTLHVAPVKNTIDLSSEISDKNRFRVYRPGVEVDITNAVINRFIFDGNLKITTLDKADAVLEAKLMDYRRDPLRYSQGNDVQEVRLSLVLDAVLYRTKDRKVLWHEGSLTGDTTFFLSGERSVSEDEAVAKATEDVARRVVEKTIELW